MKLKFKSLLACILAIVMSFGVFALAACTGNGDESGANDDEQHEQLPDEENPDEGNPDEGNPDEENPDEGNPDEGNPDEGNPDEGNPDEGNPDEGNPDEGNPDEENPDEEDPQPSLPDDATPTIYLAGDSTVKTYEDDQFIGGWGQYLDLFLDDTITVSNAAQGGRSSRSFINEGRLLDIDDPEYDYSFSQNNGQSIESVIEEGDFLFIQFGHNDDDTKKESSYSTMYNRMVPLGEPDANGIYPTVVPTEDMKSPTTYLPEEFINNSSAADQEDALEEIAKYGSTYYAYDCGTTYKGFLKVYIDFAREAGATPVLVTPVARVDFNDDGTLQDGPGRHGDEFAYVQAVRQLAEEEDVLLVDLFDFTKDALETATEDFADFLMALVPNDLTGTWPTDYDNAYGNAELGFEKIEGTHYNKYGAFITAAAVAQTILDCGTTTLCGENDSEYFNFVGHVLTTPEQYIDPSNRLSISKVAELEGILKDVNVTNPDRTYKQPSEVISAIKALQALGPVTADNYLEMQVECQKVRAEYESLNFDYRDDVTNYNVLVEYETAVEEQIEAHRPKPLKTVVISADDITDLSTAYTEDGHTFTFTSDLAFASNYNAIPFEHNGQSYGETSQAIYLNGSSGLTGSSPKKYVEFNLEGACRVTIAAESSGDDTRTVNLVKDGELAGAFNAESTMTVTTIDVAEGGTYRIGSASKNIAVYYIIIEYFE